MAAMTRARLRRLAHQQLDESGLSLRSFAADIGLTTAAHLCAFLKHGVQPNPTVIAALGYRLVDRYEPSSSGPHGR